MSHPLHWSVPTAFWLACLFGIMSAMARWPDLLPWGMAFWVGWFTGKLHQIQVEMTKSKPLTRA
jgi:hypothetical protein